MSFGLVALVVCLAGPSPTQALAPLETRTPVGYRLRSWEPASSISSLAVSNQGTIWLAARLGLLEFDGERFTTMSASATLVAKGQRLSKLLAEASGDLWVGTEGDGLFKLNSAGLIVAHLNAQRGLPGAGVTALWQADDGRLWVGTDKGAAVVWQDRVERVVGQAQGLPDNRVLLMAAAPGGHVWIETEGGLSLVGERVLSTQRLAFPWTVQRRQAILAALLPAGVPPANDDVWRALPAVVSGVLHDKRGRTWIPTSAGLFLFDGKKLSRLSTQDGLASAHVTAVAIDREQNVWAASMGGGLTQVAPTVVYTMGLAQGLSTEEVSSVAVNKQGNVVALTPAGVHLVNVEGAPRVPLPAWVDPARLGSVVAAQDGSLWFAGEMGVVHATADKATLVWNQSTVAGLAATAQGAAFFTAAGSLHLVQANDEMQELRTEGSVSALASDDHGGLWVGTSDGHVLHVDQDDVGRTQLAAKLGEAVRVRALFPQGSTLWAASSQGIWRIQNGNARSVSQAHGMLDDNVGVVAVDEQGYVWALTERGLNRINPQTFNATITSPQDIAAWGTDDGVRPYDVRFGGQPRAARSVDGRLWFATLRGVVVVEAPANRRRLDPPAARVGRVLMDDEPMLASAEAVVPPGAHRLAFSFAAPTLSEPHRVHIQHRLRGYETAWVNDGSARDVIYANLPPGAYVFEARTKRTDHAGTSAVTTVALRVQPRFRQTWLFYALCAGVLALAFVSLQTLRSWQLKARFRAVMQERHRIAREMHDTLSQVFAALGLALDTARREVKNSGTDDVPALVNARQLLAHARLASRQILANTREVPASSRALPQALAELPAVFGHAHLRYETKGQPFSLPLRVQNDLLRVAEEAVSNAISHGKAENIFVELLFAAPGLSLFVRDDGHGLQQGDAIEGLGMIGMRERVAGLGGTLEITSEPGAGTEIAVSIASVPN